MYEAQTSGGACSACGSIYSASRVLLKQKKIIDLPKTLFQQRLTSDKTCLKYKKKQKKIAGWTWRIYF